MLIFNIFLDQVKFFLGLKLIQTHITLYIFLLNKQK
jgi:hypothetical protein